MKIQANWSQQSIPLCKKPKLFAHNRNSYTCNKKNEYPYTFDVQFSVNKYNVYILHIKVLNLACFKRKFLPQHYRRRHVKKKYNEKQTFTIKKIECFSKL